MQRKLVFNVARATLLAAVLSCADQTITPTRSPSIGVPAAGSMSRISPVSVGMSASTPLAGPLSKAYPGNDASPNGLARSGSASLLAGPPMRMVWQNTSTGDRSIWLMSGTSWDGSYVSLPQVPTVWSIAGAGDFNADGSVDIVWQNTSTGDRSIWFMSGNTWNGAYASLPQVSTQWSIAGVGDFNADGKPDLVWQNTTTGDRSIWFMNGSTWAGAYALLPQVAIAWSIAAVGDFNADAKPDLVWQNTSTGDRSIWFMNGSTWNGSYAALPQIPTAWRIAAAADFDGDSKPDLVWQNINTGERSIWLMNGSTWAGSYASLPTVPTQWSIAAVMSGAGVNPACAVRTPHTIGGSDCAFSDGTYVDFYSTTVSTASAFVFNESSTAFDTYLVLASTDLTPIAENDDDPTAATTNSRLKVLLPAAGYVVAASSFDAGATGSYSLSSAGTSVDIAGCEEVYIVRGLITTQNVQTTDCVDSSGPYYGDAVIIFLVAGQQLTISMNSTAFDAYLELYNDAGGLVAFNNNANGSTTNAQIVYTPTASGYYVMFASTNLASTTGAYTLQIQ